MCLLAGDGGVTERAEVILKSHLDREANSGNVIMFEPKLHDEQVGRGIALRKTLLHVRKSVCTYGSH